MSDIYGACNEDFELVRETCKPALISGGTPACIEAFKGTFNNGFAANAAHARALLFVCLGANDYNTGFGYGFDGSVITGAEFVVENGKLEEDLDANVYFLYPEV